MDKKPRDNKLQTYDLLNEVGVNLANIQDDIQMGYMNMEDYLEFTRTEKMHTPKKDVKLSPTTAKIRNRDEKDFKDQWDAGIKMKWDYVPVENQKPQINWRQDINSADKSPAKLSSYQQGNGLGGTGIIAKSTVTSGKAADFINKNIQSMQDLQNGDLKKSSGSDNGSEKGGNIDYEELAIKATKSAASQITEIAMDDVINNMHQYNVDQTLQNIAKENKLDPLLILAVAAVETRGDAGKEGGMFNSKKKVNLKTVADQITNFCNEYFENKDLVKVTGENPIAVCQAYNGWNGVNTYKHILTDKEKSAANNNGDTSDTSNNNINNSSNSTDNENTGKQKNFIEKKVDFETAVYDVEWVELVYSSTGLMEALEYFPKICYAYQILQSKAEAFSSLTTKTGDGYEFPIKTTDLMFMYFVQDYGVTNVGSGVTLVSKSCLFRTNDETPVISAHDGTVTEVGENDEIGKFLKIKCAHDNGTVVYGRLKTISVSQGNSVSKGAVVANTTEGFALQFIDHQGQYKDPKTQWPLLSGKLDEKTSIGKQIENLSK